MASPPSSPSTNTTTALKIKEACSRKFPCTFVIARNWSCLFALPGPSGLPIDVYSSPEFQRRTNQGREIKVILFSLSNSTCNWSKSLTVTDCKAVSPYAGPFMRFLRINQWGSRSRPGKLYHTGCKPCRINQRTLISVCAWPCLSYLALSCFS